MKKVIQQHAIPKGSTKLSDAICLDHGETVRAALRASIAARCFKNEETRLEGITRLADVMQSAMNKDFGFQKDDVGRLADAHALEMQRNIELEAGMEAGGLYRLLGEREGIDRCADYVVSLGDMDHIDQFFREVIGGPPPRERLYQLLYSALQNLGDSSTDKFFLSEIINAASNAFPGIDRAALSAIANRCYEINPSAGELATLFAALQRNPSAIQRMESVFGVQKIGRSEKRTAQHKDLLEALNDPQGTYAAWYTEAQEGFLREFDEDEVT
ncbi:MAG: hypothetical protein Q7R81_04945 [Candidatus Peregrinibacteria bacterium]|nr:hypothetical protein [Candidatus Peregrinibacteria bacterium]